MGRIAKWGTRLGSFDIWYRPRSLVKGQVLVDFVAEFSSRKGSGDGLPFGCSALESIYGQCVQCNGGRGWDCYNL